MNPDELGTALARKLFELGSDPRMACTRIEFKAENADKEELPRGGLCESAAARFFSRVIQELTSGGSDAQS